MSVTAGIPCALMRGGTSKGLVLLADDLPADDHERDDLLLRLMGSPDPRQIDGLGGAHPLTSKVAIVARSADIDADVDYLFLQVAVAEASVSSSQTCGNMLAAVGPFAVEHGLVPATEGSTQVRVRLVNTGDLADLTVQTPGGKVTYDGDAEIAGVPETAAPVLITTEARSTPLFPTGSTTDVLDGHDVTCVDNGMPSVLVRAADLGVDGTEDPRDLEQRADLTDAVGRIRAEAADRMGLIARGRRDGEGPEETLARLSTPKIVLLSPPRAGGSASTRTFIPVRVHDAIGVLCAASVAAAAVVPGTVAADLTSTDDGAFRIEHPSGFLDLRVERSDDPDHPVRATSLVRTARLLLTGTAFPGPARSHRPTEDQP